jgi:Rhs element Vgr protein
MPQSPDLPAGEVVRVNLFSDGQAVDSSVELVNLTIERAFNRVPSARLELLDGDMPNQTFPVSDSTAFKPGALIRVEAGYGDTTETLFEGLVIKHGVRLGLHSDSQLVVECRDKAVRMTVGRCNANYVDKKDSDVISTLLSKYSLDADVQATTPQHKELVQYYCTDWDFMLERAEAKGLLVCVDNGKVAVKAPEAAAQAVLSVGYGIDLRAFQAEMDAREQYSAVQAVAWDMKNQAVVEGSTADPAELSQQGNLDSAALAEVIQLSSLRLQTDVPADSEVLAAWAKAQQLKSGLARIRGHMSFQGSAKAKPGSVVALTGVGERFSGDVLLSSVRHRIADGDWVTEAHFGLSPHWLTEQTDVMAPAAAGLMPGVAGLRVGEVMKLDADPQGECRVQVRVPVMQAETEGVWARLLQLHASNGFGTFFLPEVGDEVVLGFFNDDPWHPAVIGSLYSSARKPAYELKAENDTKAIVTRCKHTIEFDEKDKIITIKTPGNNKVVLSDKDKSIVLEDQNSNKIELGPDGITLSSPKDIKLDAKGGMTLNSVAAMNLSSKADVGVKGLNVNREAQVSLSAKGTASAEFSASGQTVVKGAMVMIN